MNILIGILIYLGVCLIFALIIGKSMHKLGKHDETVTQSNTENEVISSKPETHTGNL